MSLKDDKGKPYVKEAGQVRFAVEELFKGNEAAEITIKVDSEKGTSCGPYGFKRGERYVVYAYVDEKNENILYTGACTRTKTTNSEYAKDDLNFLRNLPPPGTGGNISGLIYADTKGKADLRLPDVRVKISNAQGQVITAFTDRKGEFEVKQLPPGKYKVKPDFPANYTSEHKFLEINVDDRGTADVTFVAYVDGRVSGRVIDRAGNSFNAVFVEIENEEGQNVSGFSTDDDGAFEVEGAPPGHYVLYIETHSPDQQTETKRYYYPGTFEREKATTIRVGLGERVEGLEFILPPGTVVRTIEGVVVWKDSTPAADVEVLLFCQQSSAKNGLVVYFSTSTQTDGRGRFRLEGFAGETYLIQARGRKEGKGELIEMHSPSRKISEGDGVRDLKLTLSGKGYFGKGDCQK